MSMDAQRADLLRRRLAVRESPPCSEAEFGRTLLGPHATSFAKALSRAAGVSDEPTHAASVRERVRGIIDQSSLLDEYIGMPGGAPREYSAISMTRPPTTARPQSEGSSAVSSPASLPAESRLATSAPAASTQLCAARAATVCSRALLVDYASHAARHAALIQEEPPPAASTPQDAPCPHGGLLEGAPPPRTTAPRPPPLPPAPPPLPRLASAAAPSTTSNFDLVPPPLPPALRPASGTSLSLSAASILWGRRAPNDAEPKLPAAQHRRADVPLTDQSRSAAPVGEDTPKTSGRWRACSGCTGGSGGATTSSSRTRARDTSSSLTGAHRCASARPRQFTASVGPATMVKMGQVGLPCTPAQRPRSPRLLARRVGSSRHHARCSAFSSAAHSCRRRHRVAAAARLALRKGARLSTFRCSRRSRSSRAAARYSARTTASLVSLTINHTHAA